MIVLVIKDFIRPKLQWNWIFSEIDKHLDCKEYLSTNNIAFDVVS